MARRRSTRSLPRYQAVPTRERVEDTHRAIIAAAVHAFRVRGYAATTMPTVAALAGVSPRTLYRYFGSKSELFAATIAEATADFLEQLSIQVRIAPLREAILAAFEHADVELNEESREMTRLAAADEKVWRYFLGATSRMQPTTAATLRSAVAGDQPAEPSADETLFWDVKASALLGALAAAYRRWAVTPGSELSDLVASAVDIVLPTIGHPRHHSASTDVNPRDCDSG